MTWFFLISKSEILPYFDVSSGQQQKHGQSFMTFKHKMPNGPSTDATHYEVLGLPNFLAGTQEVPAQGIIKTAYRRALLLHHPDKHKGTDAGAAGSKNSPKFTIDEITTAYTILHSAQSRAAYDRDLRLQPDSRTTSEEERQVFKTGVETLDLDDLSYDEEKNEWYRECRCGDERGFLVQEADLEEAAADGEIGVGCRGCSLWIKVLFGVMEE
jgi:diphthamide biosynthesis protein 4